jgi:hypothetical protein
MLGLRPSPPSLSGKLMDPVRMLHWEMFGFLWLFVALLVYRMLTRQINMAGLLRDDVDGKHVSPERVQLLIATLAVSARIFQEAWHGTGNSMPDISAQWLGLFGASGGVYASVKGFRVFRSKQAQQALNLIGRL